MARKILVLLTAPLLLGASGCVSKVTTQAYMPSAADVNVFAEEKPRYTPEMLTSSKLNDQHNAEIEAQLDRFRAAGKRICDWLNTRGGKFICAK